MSVSMMSITHLPYQKFPGTERPSHFPTLAFFGTLVNA